jgi:hypothetical protein
MRSKHAFRAATRAVLSTRRSRAALAAALVAISITFARPARAEDAKTACSRAYDETQAERTSGKLAAARQSAAICTDLACPDFIRKDCGKWLEQIESAQPSVVLHARRGGGDITAVEVQLDGTKWLDRLEGRSMPIDPGQHVLRFSSDGLTLERSLLVVEGERNRVIEIDLPGAAPPIAKRSNGPWIVGGIGLAALATGGVMTGILVHEKALNDAGCPGATCTAAGRSAGETGRTLGPITTTSFAVGGVGVATGAIWLWMANRRRAANNIGVAPVLTSSCRGVSAEVSF